MFAACPAQVNSAINAGQWWRFLTPALLHGDSEHLESNNKSLQSLGPMLEDISGPPRFLAVYVISALTGSLASYRMSTRPSVGASGEELARVLVTSAMIHDIVCIFLVRYCDHVRASPISRYCPRQ